MSQPNERARPPASGSGSAGKLTADGRRVYRLTTPLVIWWAWVGLLVLCAGDLVIQGHEFVSLQFAFAALTVTGVVFACTLWPRVIADDEGITVLNPFRRFDIPWGAVKGIFLADSVEVRCARSAEKKDKTVFSWALSAPRRARARQQLRARQWAQGTRSRPSGYDRLPGQGKEMAKILPAEVIARELAGLSDQAKSGSDGKTATARAAASSNGDGTGTAVPGAVMRSTWAWLPVASVLLPAIGFVLTEILK